MCGVDGCERPAGFATDHPGTGACRRHGGNAKAAGVEASPLDTRLQGPGVPATSPPAVVCNVLVVARAARFAFDEAWPLAAEAALSHMPDSEAREWWAALLDMRQTWADAYTRSVSRIAAPMR